jgi:hypothetical protein
MLWVGKVHLSEIISSVELYRFNIGEGLFSEWEKYTSVKLYLVLSYTVNIGGGLCCEWEKYTSVKLYLVLSYTILI